MLLYELNMATSICNGPLIKTGHLLYVKIQYIQVKVQSKADINKTKCGKVSLAQCYTQCVWDSFYCELL